MNDDNGTWWQRLLKLDPAIFRGILVAVAALLLQVVGHTVVDDSVIDAIIDIFTGVSAIVAAVTIRPAVTPNAKVVVRDDTPLARVSTLQPGPAVPSGDVTNEQLSYFARTAA